MLQALGLPGFEIRGLLARFGGGVVVPQLLLYLLLRNGTSAAALIVAGGWTTGLLAYDLLRRRALDPLLLYGLVFTVVQGIVALVARSATVYVGGGVVENLLDGLALLVSIAVCRPLLVVLVNSTLGGRAVVTGPVHAALERLTLAWALALLARSAGLYAALTHLAIGPFLVVNTLARWPVNGVGLVLSLAYLRAALLRAHPVQRAAVACAAPRRWRFAA